MTAIWRKDFYHHVVGREALSYAKSSQKQSYTALICHSTVAHCQRDEYLGAPNSTMALTVRLTFTFECIARTSLSTADSMTRVLQATGHVGPRTLHVSNVPHYAMKGIIILLICTCEYVVCTKNKVRILNHWRVTPSPDVYGSA